MYMFIRTWCWPGTISAGPPGPCAILAWSSAVMTSSWFSEPGLVDGRLPELERPVHPRARAARSEHRASRVERFVPVEELDAERIVDVSVVVETSVQAFDVLGRHEVQEVLVEVGAHDVPAPLP